MGFYSRHILPRLVDHACGLELLARQRRKVVPLARGRVLEIGFGSGHNLPFYDRARVTNVWGLEPSVDMRRLAEPAVRDTGFEVSLVDATGEQIPLDRHDADTVVMTYTLCSVADPAAVLAEIARVLRPGGQVLLCEHGAAPEPSVLKWQRRVTPVWKRFAGGCHLDRNPRQLLESAGFRADGIEVGYLAGWKPASYNYWGHAEPG